MCSVLIIEKANSCRVVCECGYDHITRYAPDLCPQCGHAWDERRFEDGNAPTPGPASSLDPFPTQA
jgi:hypothetical protein